MKKVYKSIFSLIVCLILSVTCSTGIFAEDISSEDNIKVAFAGDSICIGYNGYYGFPNVTIDNYGVGGDTTEDALEIVKGIRGDYDKLFLICGVNDCTNDDWLDETFVDSMANFKGMFEAAKQNLPNAKVYVTGIFPTLGRQKHLVPTSIKYNAALKQLIEKYDNVTFIGDVCWDALLDSETGLGKAEYYNRDGLHPKKEGYDVLNKVLKPYMYDNYKELEGNVYYQVSKKENSTMRFVAEMNIEDVQKAMSGNYTIAINDSQTFSLNIERAYKALKANGLIKTAPEGKCYVITDIINSCKTGDSLKADFYLDGFKNSISRVVTIK